MLMAKGGQRRSARLVALEQQKHEKAANVVSKNVEGKGNARSIGRKRSRRKKVRDVYEVSYEYTASLNHPAGDYGTPWHSLWDGVRTTQEQLENDIGTMEREWSRGSNSRPRGRKETEHPESSDEQRRYTYMHGRASESLIRMVVDTQKQLVYNKNGMDYRESTSHFVKDAGPVAKLVAEKRCLEYSVKAHARKTYERERAYTFNSNASSMHSFFNFSGHHTFGVNPTTATAPISWNPPAPSRLEDPYSIVLPTFVVDPASSCQMDNSTPGSSDGTVLGDFGCKLETDKLLTMFSQIGTPEFLNNSSNMASSSNREIIRDLDPAHTFAGI